MFRIFLVFLCAVSTARCFVMMTYVTDIFVLDLTAAVSRLINVYNSSLSTADESLHPALHSRIDRLLLLNPAVALLDGIVVKHEPPFLPFMDKLLVHSAPTIYTTSSLFAN